MKVSELQPRTGKVDITLDIVEKSELVLALPLADPSIGDLDL